MIADTGAPAHEVNILNVVGRGFFWQDLLDTDVYGSGSVIANVKGVTPSTVNRLVRMGLLVPDLIEELMAGKQPTGWQSIGGSATESPASGANGQALCYGSWGLRTTGSGCLTMVTLAR